jgi:hypothetical protein
MSATKRCFSDCSSSANFSVTSTRPASTCVVWPSSKQRNETAAWVLYRSHSGRSCGQAGCVHSQRSRARSSLPASRPSSTSSGSLQRGSHGPPSHRSDGAGAVGRVIVIAKKCGLCEHSRKVHYDITEGFLRESPNPPCQLDDCTCNGFWPGIPISCAKPTRACLSDCLELPSAHLTTPDERTLRGANVAAGALAYVTIRRRPSGPEF